MTAARACTRWPASHGSDTPSTSHPHHIHPFETMRGHLRCMRRPLWPCAGAQRSSARVRGEPQTFCGHCSSHSEELMAQPSGRSRPCHLPGPHLLFLLDLSRCVGSPPLCSGSTPCCRHLRQTVRRQPHDPSPTHVPSRARSTRAGSSEQTSRRPTPRPRPGRQGRKCRVRFRTGVAVDSPYACA